MARRYRLFLSSPGDVATERGIVEEVVRRINDREGPDGGFDLYRWEHEHYTAAATFQDQIPHASDSDLVVCVFWKRLGSELPTEFARPDGSIPTGSEFEFEQAIEHAIASDDQLPDIYVFRSEAEVTFRQQTLDDEREQFRMLEAFWKRWFRNEQGHFTAAFDTYPDTATFENKITSALTDWLDKRRGTAIWTDGSPFRGLQPFDVEHAPIFFGRRRETARARARLMVLALTGRRFMLISGPSGSGKSSLVRAGLIPALERPGAGEVLPDQRLHLITSPALLCPDPERHPDWTLPFARLIFSDPQLAEALGAGDFPTPDQLAPLLSSGAPANTALTSALRRIGADLTPARPVGLTLLLDQMEEIFSWPPDMADAFLACLHALAAASPGADGITVVATMRSEFHHRLPDIPALARLTRFDAIPGPDDPDPVIDITLPALADIRDMIDGPAAAAGLTFEAARDVLPPLNQRIEAAAVPDALPALQYLLTQLYLRRSGDTLTHNAFADLGGVAGVMAHQGEEIIKTHGAAALPPLVRALVKGGTPPTARRVDAGIFASDPALSALVRAFIDDGLIVSDERTLRLAHESLITGWTRLTEIVKRERRLFDSRDRLADLTPKFIAENTHFDGFLLGEARELAHEWGDTLIAEAHPDLPGLIDDSIAAARRKARRRVTGFIGLGVAVIAAAIGLAFWQFQVAQDRARLLNASERNYATSQSETATREDRRADALDFALLAHESIPDANSLSLVMEKSLLLSSPGHQWTRTGDFTATAWTKDGTLLAATRDKKIHEFAPDGTATLRANLPTVGTHIARLAKLPDNRIAYLVEGGQLFVTSDSDPTAAETLHDSGIQTNTGFARDLTVIGDGVAVMQRDDRNQQIDLTYCPPPLGTPCNTLQFSSPGIIANTANTALAFDGPDALIVNDFQLFRLKLDGDRFRSPNNALSFRPRGPEWREFDFRIQGFTVQGGLATLSVIVFDAATNKQLVRSLVIGARSGIRDTVREPDDRASDFITRLATAHSSAAHKATAFSYAPDLIAVKWPDREEIRTIFRTPSRLSLDMAFAPDGNRLSLRQSGALSVFDIGPTLSSPRPIGRNPVVPRPIESLDVAADGTLVHEGARLADGTPIENEDATSFTAIAASPHGSVAGIRPSGLVMEWSPDNPWPTPVLEMQDVVTRLTYTGNGQLVLLRLDGLFAGDRFLPASESVTLGGIVADPTDPDAVYFSDSDGRLQRWLVGAPSATVAVPPADSEDRSAGLSLSLEPLGRWLTSTRSDDQIRVYDLTGELEPVSLPIDSEDSKVVTFAPDGRHLAALSSAGQVYVWSFDITTGAAERLFAVDPMPLPNPYGQDFLRAAQWIDWQDDTRLAIATSQGEILTLSIDADAWLDRARRILPRAVDAAPPP